MREQEKLIEAFNLIYDNMNSSEAPDKSGNVNAIIAKLDQLIILQSEAASIDRMINTAEVEKISGFEISTIRKMIKAGKFPPPKKYGRSSRWKLSDIQEWISMQ